jgi:hypothetical protein
MKKICAYRITNMNTLYSCHAGCPQRPEARQILIAKRVNLRDDSSDRWNARFLSPLGFSDFRMPARILRLSSALRDSISVPGKRSP